MSLLLDLGYFIAAFKYKKKLSTIKSNAGTQDTAICKAQQQERERISADMHDELGSGITAIRLMTELARKKLKEPVPAELQRISSTAEDLLNNMNAIIWSMNSTYDSLDNLVYYIKTWSIDYFEPSSLDCQVRIPVDIPEIVVDGVKRRNIYLAVKESLNNIIKHAGATRVLVTIECGLVFKIHISDNGRGIDTKNPRLFGQGIRNMKRRMESIGGKFKLESVQGTSIWFEVPMKRF